MFVKKLILLRKDQKEFIESLPGKNTEHIRCAIDDYIAKMRSRADATTSPSKRKEEILDGQSGTNIEFQPSATQAH